MSNKLVINPHLVTPTYSGQFPIRSLPKNIRSSSSRGTNISSSPKSASLTPDYPIPLPYSPIRSSKNLSIFYSKLLRPEGGFELDLNHANTAVNQHFLPPYTATRPRFPNIKLSNLSMTIKPRLTIVDSFYGYYRSLQGKQIYEIF